MVDHLIEDGPVPSVVPPAIQKPLLRGVLHQIAIVGSDGTPRHAAAAVFAGSVAVCFGASALYHRVTWTARARLWMRRLDHAGVYLLIAGTYTPVCLLVLTGAWRLGVVTVVSVGAGVGIAAKFVWADAPKWFAASLESLSAGQLSSSCRSWQLSASKKPCAATEGC